MIIAPEGIYILKPNKKKKKSKNFEKQYKKLLTEIMDSDNSINIDIGRYFHYFKKGKGKYNVFNLLKDYVKFLTNSQKFIEDDKTIIEYLIKVENILTYINYLIFDVIDDSNIIEKISLNARSIQKFIDKNGGIDCSYFPYTDDIKFSLPIVESNAPKSNIRLSSHKPIVSKYNYT